MEIIELRSDDTGGIIEEVFDRKVTNASYAVVMLHFVE